MNQTARLEQSEADKIWAELDAEDAGTKPAAPSEPLPEAKVELEPAAPAVQADAQAGDPEKQVLMDTINGLQLQMSQMQTRLRNAEGHIGGLNGQLRQQQQIAQQMLAKGSEAPSATQIRAAQTDPDAMAKLKQDYPEFATAIESVMDHRVGELQRQLNEARQTLEQQQQQQRPSVGPSELQALRSELLVESRHPGWIDTVRTPEFAGWLERQPREVQWLKDSVDPRDAIRLLDLHSEAKKSAAKANDNKQLSSAAAIPNGRTGARVAQKSVDDMSPEEYWAYLDQVDASKR